MIATGACQIGGSPLESTRLPHNLVANPWMTLTLLTFQTRSHDTSKEMKHTQYSLDDRFGHVNLLYMNAPRGKTSSPQRTSPRTSLCVVCWDFDNFLDACTQWCQFVSKCLLPQFILQWCSCLRGCLTSLPNCWAPLTMIRDTAHRFQMLLMDIALHHLGIDKTEYNK